MGGSADSGLTPEQIARSARRITASTWWATGSRPGQYADTLIAPGVACVGQDRHGGAADNSPGQGAYEHALSR